MEILGLFFLVGGGFFVPIILMVLASRRIGRMRSIVALSLLTVPFLYGQHYFNQWIFHAHHLTSDGPVSGAEVLLFLLSVLIVLWASALMIASRKTF